MRAIVIDDGSADEFGLAAALLDYLNRLQHADGPNVEMDLAALEGLRLPIEIRIALCRIVEEASDNAVRHARASNLAVIVLRGEGTVIAIIEDNGIGFDPAEALARGAPGLLVMQERAAVFGGHLTIESTPGIGTTVFAELPDRLPAAKGRAGQAAAPDR